MSSKHKSVFVNAILVAVIAFTGCGERVTTVGPSSVEKDPYVQRLLKDSDLAAELEANAGVVVEVHGSPGDELITVSRWGNSPLPKGALSCREFDAALSGIGFDNKSAVVRMAGDGFSLPVARNVADILQSRGFTSVHVVALRWGGPQLYRAFQG